MTLQTSELEFKINIEQLIDKFKQFLTSNDKYIDEINTIIIQRRKSICIDFPDLILFDRELADLLIEHPREITYAASEALRQIILEKDPEFAKNMKVFHARFRKLSESIPLRKLRSSYIGKLIMIEGIVTRETPPRHFLKKMVFKCDNCGFEVDVPQYYAVPTQPPKKCIRCGGVLKLVQEKCEYVDWQKIIVQEKPEELPPGQLPRSVEVILTDDLVDTVKPGDRVYVIGILDINAYELKRNKPPVLSSYIEANYIEAQQKEFAEVEITPEDQRIIEELAREPNIREKIIRSIAPSIYGLEDVKEAIACLLFGGVPKIYPDGVRVRGDIHVLLVGDPGTGKSQLLRFVARIAPRAVYTTGKGSSAAGLCIGGDSVVYTSIGILPIRVIVKRMLKKYGKEDIDNNVLICRDPKKIYTVSLDFENMKISKFTVSQYYEIHTKKLTRIITSLGKEIVTTPETKILVYDNGRIVWKKACDIKEGDYIVEILNIPHILESKKYLKKLIKMLIDSNLVLGIDYSRGLLQLSLKNVIKTCTGLVRFLAYAYTSSYIDNDVVIIRLRHVNSLNNVLNILSNIIHEKPILEYCGDGVVVKVRDRKLVRILKKLNIDKPIHRRFIHPYITLLPKCMIRIFLKELFNACGELEKSKIVIKLPNKVISYQVDFLLRLFGILCRICKLNSEYVIEIFDSTSVRKFLIEILRKYHNPSTVCSNFENDVVYLSDGIVSVRVCKIDHLCTDVEVYDFTVDNVHSFIANGFVVHNTAAVVKDKLTGEFYLEAGALVLADMGVCIIDEIDKMDAKDRVAMHEALEQQTISIAKAGIVATLNARCAVLAAANPAFGRYLPNRTVAENVDLPVTLLSRFDLIFIIRDQPMIDQDKKVAEHVTTLHSGELPAEFRDIIPPDLLRKYIAYARKYVKPRWTKEAKDIIMEFYISLRSKSSDPNSPIAITARQLEALIRLAEAEAKMRLSPLVEKEDAERAIRLFEKFLRSVGIDIETGKIDIDIIMTGKPRSKQEKFAVLRDIIAKLEEANGGKPVKIEDVIKEAENAGLDRQTVEQLINIMIKNGDLYMPRHGYIKRVSAT